jgi:hypothetical protein
VSASVPAFDFVDLPGAGRVIVAPVDQLREAREAARATARDLFARVAAIAASAEERLADAGAALVPQRALWPVPPALHGRLRRADELVAQLADIDGRRRDPASSAEPGPFRRLRAWRLAHRLDAARDAACLELRGILVEVARAAGATGAGSSQAGPVLDEVRALEEDAARVQREGEACEDQAAALQREIGRREASRREMGFDALYTAAYLERHGPLPIRSPLELEAGEMAVFALPCTLARMAGARPRQVLRDQDAGTLVVTTRRVGFVGEFESVVVPLHEVMHVDVYRDALAVFHLGRETAHYFLVPAPKRALFYLNWVRRRDR